MIDWQISSVFGWGIYGLNLMLQWSQQQKQPLMTYLPPVLGDLHVNPLEWARLQSSLEPALEWPARMEPLRGRLLQLEIPMLRAMGNNFSTLAPSLNGVRFVGTPNIAMPFFEYTAFTPEGLARGAEYPLMIAGSTWNLDLMKAAGIRNTALVLQGVDPTRFHPAPRAGWFNERFAIFSGGKLEFRKGQDLVLKAFRIFAERHKDAVLVTAWNSPWPYLAKDLHVSTAIAPVLFHPNGKINTAAWAVANGIPAEQFIDLGTIANGEMPRLLREMSVGLFPNRAEGGTNLVAMECMASGVPCILSANTGHLDLIADDRCYQLTRQLKVVGERYEGWGESDVEEVLEVLEEVYRDRAASLARAARGAAFMSKMTWAETARQLAEAIAPVIQQASPTGVTL